MPYGGITFLAPSSELNTMTSTLTRYSIATGLIIGGAIRLTMAHGNWSLFFNPWFPMLVHYQPWL
jgi:hypothetical protein